MRRLTASAAISFLAFSMLAGAAGAAEETFSNPRMFDLPIDWCASKGGACGSAGADLFCQSRGYEQSLHFTKAHTDAKTLYFASGKACNDGTCEALTEVVCSSGAAGGLEVEATSESSVGEVDDADDGAASPGPNAFPQVVQTFPLKGQIKNDPSYVVNKADPDHPFAVFGRGMDDALWWTSGDGVGGWKNWKQIGGGIKFAPGCTSHHSSAAGPKAYVIACFVVGLDDAVWYTEQYSNDPGRFSGFTSLGGATQSSPSAVAAADELGNRALYVFVRGLDNRLWYNHYRVDVISNVDPVGWLGWTPIGYDMAGAPTCVAMGGNHVDCYFRDSNGQIIEAPDVFARGPQTPLGGETQKRPGVMVSADFKQVRILVKGMDDRLWVRSWKSGSGFADWRGTELAMLGQPNCRSLGDGRASCVSVDGTGNVKVDVIPFDMVQ